MASVEQLYDAAYAAGFRGPDADRIVAIALAESGGQEGATANTSAEYSVGPLQINLKAGHAISEADARDPYKAMQYAYQLVHNTPQGWEHWSVYSNGSYASFMPGGSDPYAQQTTTVPTGRGGTVTSGSGDIPNPFGGAAPASPYRSEDLPGLAFSQADGRYYNPTTGKPATYSEVQRALDQKYPAGHPDGITAADLLSANVQMRGQDVSAATSRYGYDTSAANAAADRGQRAYEFGNLSAYEQATLAGQNEDRAFAKEQWLFQKQNAIDELQLQRDTLATQQAQNARMYTLENEKLQFYRDQFAFESSIALRQETRATEAQLFNQQATVAGMQLEMASIQSQVAQTNARLQTEVAVFNAGKAADVSMFNIDQQTKVAMFNAESQLQAGMFNSEMGFNVQKANVENERLRQQQLIDVASRISEAAKDPGDRAALASLILALGSSSGFGGMDAGLAGADLRTDDSLMPLEAMLRQRADILDSEVHPFSFTPVEAERIAPPAPATFTPATASLAPAPDFSNVQMPTPNTTPFDPASIPTSAPAPAPTYDSTKQGFIATGQTSTADNQQFINTATGQPLTAEERAQIPEIALQDMIASGIIKRMEGGGLFNQGNVTPFGDMRTRGQDAASRYRANRPASGMPPSTPSIQPVPGNMPSAPNTPFTMPTFGDGSERMDWFNGLPTQPGVQDGRQFVQALLQRISGDPRFAGLSQAVQQLMQQINQRGGLGMPPSTPTIQPVPSQPAQSQPAQSQPVPSTNSVPGGQPRPADMPQYQDWDFSVPQRGYVPQAEGGGMMKGAFIAGDSSTGDEAEEIVIPLGPGMAIVLPHKVTERMMKGGKGPKKKMAQGGLFQQQGQSMYEGLVPDQNRARAQSFLGEASRRAAMGTPWDVNRLPTPVFASSPGTSRFVTDLLASLNAIRRGIPPEYFKEQAALLAPAAYSEGVIGRTR